MKIRNLSLRNNLVNLYLKYKYELITRNFKATSNYNSRLEKDGWENTLNEDFDNGTYNKDIWHVDKDDTKNMMWWATPHRVENSNVYFQCKYNPKVIGNKRYLYETGILYTGDKFTQRYGRFECRCKMPKGKNTWAAFWLIGWSKRYAEIDIFETYGKDDAKTVKDICFNLWYPKNNINGWSDDGLKQLRDREVKLKDEYDATEVYHEYAVEWYEDRIDWFIDNNKVFTVFDRQFLNDYFNKETPMQIIINNATQLTISDKSVDNEFIVDYIRVYKKK